MSLLDRLLSAWCKVSCLVFGRHSCILSLQRISPLESRHKRFDCDVYPVAFLDTNVILRPLLHDHAVHSPAATQLVARIEAHELAVRISDTVVFETAFTLERPYRIPRIEIDAALLPILELPGVVLPGKNAFRDVFALWAQRSSLSFADCYHVVLPKRLKLNVIISFDQGLTGVEGINRLESKLT